MAADNQSLREHLAYLLNGGGAHLRFGAAFRDIPANLRSEKPPGVPYTPWRLMEHMRIAQRDILDFCRNPQYEALPFPEGYWPRGDGPEKDEEWDESLATFQSDLEGMLELVRDPATDLFAPIPWGSGQTILREGLLLADHNSYHLGETVVLRTLLNLQTEG